MRKEERGERSGQQGREKQGRRKKEEEGKEKEKQRMGTFHKLNLYASYLEKNKEKGETESRGERKRRRAEKKTQKSREETKKRNRETSA